MTSQNLVQTNNQAGGPGSAPGSNLLQLRGLNVYYGESHILRDVDLSVAPGQMVCLIGRNGVGKTTLLKTVIGLLRQRSGSVQLEDRELSPLAPHQRARSGIGYVPQGREIIPQLTVRENLMLGEGTYCWALGPQFETPAEIRAIRILGGDAVGMSTVPEVILARFLGLKVAAISTITNMAAGLSDEKISHEHTKAMAPLGAAKLERVLRHYLSNLR